MRRAAVVEYVGDVVDPGLPVVDVAQLFAVEAGAAAIEKCDVEAGGCQVLGGLIVPAAVAGDAVQERRRGRAAIVAAFHTRTASRRPSLAL